MLNTLKDIVEMSILQTGQIELNKNKINVNEMLESLYILHQPLTKEKEIQFNLKNTESKNKLIETDENKLNGILNYLILNAIKYTHEGTIELGFMIKDPDIIFYVSDTGIGIPAEKLGLIFKPFVKVDTGHDSLFEGSGLGLSISKAYSDMMGGKIWAKPNLKKGTTFYFALPNKKVSLSENYNSEKDVHINLEGINILIAEDDNFNMQYLKEVFVSYDVNIITAENGLEAIEKVKNHAEINIVLMDIKMPEMDGYQATEQIKSIRPDLPVIAQTAYAMEHDKVKALELGFNDFISKPINKLELLGKIMFVLNKYSGDKTGSQL